MAKNNKTNIRDAVANLAKIHILIADHDRRIAAIVREVLDNLGFKSIYLAFNGEEAVDIIKKEKIDMLITDWRMPGLDGISLTKYLRTSAESPNRFLPIIMLTGNVEREHVELARDVGVTEFVIKPFSSKTLCDRIKALIDNPRGFIMTKQFTGPDRRRRSNAPPDKADRRKR